MEFQSQHECIQKDVYEFVIIQLDMIELNKKLNLKMVKQFLNKVEMIELEKPKK